MCSHMQRIESHSHFYVICAIRYPTLVYYSGANNEQKVIKNGDDMLKVISDIDKFMAEDRRAIQVRLPSLTLARHCSSFQAPPTPLSTRFASATILLCTMSYERKTCDENKGRRKDGTVLVLC